MLQPQPRTGPPRILSKLGALAIGVLVPLALAEGGLRLLPVATGLASVPVNARQPVFHFAPRSEFTFSRGWNLQMVNRGRTNDTGFVSDQDYGSADPRLPLLAVIGDSYVEAAMVRWPETVHGRLTAALERRRRVHAFAASGAPLSQYLTWAQHARERFGATSYVFVVVGNDFDESLLSVKSAAGMHYFDDVSGTEPWPLLRVDYRPGSLRPVARASALARYLLLNLHADRALVSIRNRWHSPTQNWAGNTAAAASHHRVAVSTRALERFLDLLPAATQARPEAVVFLLDGVRPQMYERRRDHIDSTYFGIMRHELIERATSRGYQVIDLQPRFVDEFSRSRRRFEFPADAHWNSAGHAIAAGAVLDSRLLDDLD